MNFKCTCLYVSFCYAQPIIPEDVHNLDVFFLSIINIDFFIFYDQSGEIHENEGFVSAVGVGIWSSYVKYTKIHYIILLLFTSHNVFY